MRGIVGLLLGLLCACPALPAGAEPAPAAGRSEFLLVAGIERYRAGSYDDAITIFNSVLAGQPDNPDARLYLSLSHLGRGEDTLAARHLTTLRALPISARLRTQVDHVLEGMRAGPLNPPLRRFIAATLDETMVAERSNRPRTATGRVHSRNFPYFP